MGTSCPLSLQLENIFFTFPDVKKEMEDMWFDLYRDGTLFYATFFCLFFVFVKLLKLLWPAWLRHYRLDFFSNVYHCVFSVNSNVCKDGRHAADEDGGRFGMLGFKQNEKKSISSCMSCPRMNERFLISKFPPNNKSTIFFSTVWMEISFSAPSSSYLNSCLFFFLLIWSFFFSPPQCSPITSEVCPYICLCRKRRTTRPLLSLTPNVCDNKSGGERYLPSVTFDSKDKNKENLNIHNTKVLQMDIECK